MNTTTLADSRVTPPRLATGCATVARLLALPVAGLALCFTSLFAEVIDDFEGGVKFLDSWPDKNYLRKDLINGELKISGQLPASGDSGDSPIYWLYSPPPSDLEGRTLEVRIDLVSASADDVFLMLGVGSPSGTYYLSIDQDEVVLAKQQYPLGVASLFWVTAPVTNRNVTVVLALTPMTDALLLTSRVVEKGTGTILFERFFVDGPGVDVQVPTPTPKGVTYLVPDSGAPIVGFDSTWIGVWQFAKPPRPPLEVVVDNLEYDVYDSPALTVSSSGQVLVFSWPVSSTAFELESAPSLSPEAVWETIPTTPIVNGDRQTVTLDATATAQFFRLKQSP